MRQLLCRHPWRVMALAAALPLQGCSTLHGMMDKLSGGPAPAQAQGGPAAPRNAQPGQLAEFDVLGVDAAAPLSDEDVRRAAVAKAAMRLPRGTPLMVVQSGAPAPDDGMAGRLSRHYKVTVFSGVRGDAPANGYGRMLRLAAAKAGCDKLVVYWGLPEVGRADVIGKVVSWVPIINGTVPERPQTVRVRIRVAVVDVVSGQWDMFSSEPVTEAAGNEGYARMTVSAARMAAVTDRAYAAAVEEMTERYATR